MLSSLKVRTFIVVMLVVSACASRVVPPSTAKSVLASSAVVPELGSIDALAIVLPLPWSSEPLAAAPALEPLPPLDSFTVAPSAPLPADETLVHVVLRDVNNGDQLEVDMTRDGRVAEPQLGWLEAFLACRRSGRTHAIAPGALRALALLSEQFPGHVIEVVSGYRARPYGVRDSRHFEGHAIDLRVRGVKLTRVRDFVWRNFSDVGIGYYMEQNFVHIDYRPETKDTAWSSPHENAPREYNPRWALRIRPPWREPAVVPANGVAAGSDSAPTGQQASAALASTLGFSQGS